MPSLVGRKAPEIQVKAVVKGAISDNFSLNNYLGKYVLLFFYPLDFTFVCPTELHAFQEASPLFEQRHTQVIGCSVDSCFAHLAWLQQPRSRGGIEGVQYPLIGDINKDMVTAFGVLHPSEGVALRGLFLIDSAGIVRHQLVNDLPLGRSIDEALRMVDALQAFEKQGEVCPANWRTGQQQMSPTQCGLEKYFSAAN